VVDYGIVSRRSCGLSFLFAASANLWLFVPASVSAHHATAVQYDISQTIEFKGKISKLDWANPHVHVYIDVQVSKDRGENWDAEFLSPGSVIVSGLSRELLKPGETIVVKGYPSKAPSDGSTNRKICVTDVTLADGTHVTFGVGI
jgi:uncharacterized protein DUF6152